MKNIFINTVFFLLVFFCSCYDKDNFGEDYKLQHGYLMNMKDESPYLGTLKYGNQIIKVHSAIIEKQNLRFDDKIIYNISIKGIENKSDIATKSIKISLINDIEKTIDGEYIYDVNNTLKNFVPRIDSGSFTLSHGATKYVVDVILSGKISIRKNSSNNLSIVFDITLKSGKKITGLLVSDFSHELK